MKRKYFNILFKFSFLYDIYLSLILFPIKFSKRYIKYLMNNISRVVSKQSGDYFCKYVLLNKGNTINKYAVNENIDNVGIILQGPIRYKDNFTLNTALMYKKLYPNVRVIISTWEDEKKDFFSKCDEEGVEYIKNKYPDTPIRINYQIYSSKVGVDKYIHEPKIKYILKTRTDQRLYSEDFLEYLLSLIIKFPISGTLYDMEQRLIFFNADASTYKYYAYHLSDMLVFGTKYDISNLYSIPFITKELNLEKEKIISKTVDKLRELEHKKIKKVNEIYDIISEYEEFINYKKSVVAELYIVDKFLSQQSKVTLESQNDLIRYLEFIKHNCIIVDKEQLELYWPKYINEFWQISNSQKFGQLTFSAWLEMLVDNESEKDD